MFPPWSRLSFTFLAHKHTIRHHSARLPTGLDSITETIPGLLLELLL